MDAYEAGLEDDFSSFISLRSEALIDAAKILTNEADEDTDVTTPEDEYGDGNYYDDDGVDDSDIVDEDE